MPVSQKDSRELTASFADIVGHEAQKRHLMSALTDGHLSHAYILEGPRGVGKHLLSHAFIRTLFCQSPVAGEACGSCPSCKKLSHANHPDLKILGLQTESGKNPPTSIGKAQIRDQVVADIAIRPYESPYKVYLIEDADRMTPEAQNTLLKTMEEPPAYGILILLGESLQAFLPTILSRAVKISLPPLDTPLVTRALSARGIPEKDARESAVFSGGSIGRALSLLEDTAFQEQARELLSFFSSLPELSAFDTIQGAELFSGKERFEEALSLLELWFRDVLVYQTTKDPARLCLSHYESPLGLAARHYSKDEILRILYAIPQSRTYARANVNEKLILDGLFINFLTKQR